MKKLILCLVAAFIPIATIARLIPLMTYQQMYDRADLVFVGRVTNTTDTAERGQLPGGPTSWQVVGLSSHITISLVLKGDKDMKRCTLHHYRQTDPGQLLVDGPHFLAFAANDNSAYLMFLKREADGRYAPVSGQEDPALFSVLKVKGEAQ